MEATLTIGEVARRAGLNTSAIRYYESRGVLPQPERESGRRRYTEETVQRLHVIEVAKRAGFTLDEARVLLATAHDGTVSAQGRPNGGLDVSVVLPGPGPSPPSYPAP